MIYTVLVTMCIIVTRSIVDTLRLIVSWNIIVMWYMVVGEVYCDHCCIQNFIGGNWMRNRRLYHLINSG